MAEDNSLVKERVRTYVVDHGGTVDDPGGRVDTNKMADAVGAANAHHLRVILDQLEQEGVISREMQGPRTQRITLSSGDHPAAAAAEAPPATAPPDVAEVADVAGVHRAARASVDTAANGPVSSSPAVAPSAVAPPVAAPPVAAPPANAPAPAPPAAGGPAPAGSPDAEAPSAPPTGGAISLREAIARQAALAEQAAAAGGAAGTSGAAVVGAPSAQPPNPTASSTIVPMLEQDGSPRRQSRLRRRAAKAEAKADKAVETRAAVAEKETPDDVDDDGAERVRRGVLMPEMNAPPSNTVLIVVGVALASLVLIAVISVLANHKTPQAVPLLDTRASSIDACQVVNTQAATAALGENAGPPHLVLGECVYDDGTHELIVEVDRIDARKMFAAYRTAGAVSYPGIGDGAYYVDGSLWVLKGSSLAQLTLGPVPAATPSPQLLKLGTAAAGRLNVVVPHP